MEEFSWFVLAIMFGSFILFSLIMCCIRLFVYLTDDRKILCFKSKAALQRRRIQLSLLPEMGIPRIENLGYIPPPDEDINEQRICQPYVYEDRGSTGIRMIANLPIALAFTAQSGFRSDSIFGVYPNYPVSPNPSQRSEPQSLPMPYEELPPNYSEANNRFQTQVKTQEYIEMTEAPPPTYDECMQASSSKSFSSNKPQQCQGAESETNN